MKSVAWMAYYGLGSKKKDEYAELLELYLKDSEDESIEQMDSVLQKSLLQEKDDIISGNSLYFGLMEGASKPQEGALRKRLLEKYVKEALKQDMYGMYVSLFRQYAKDITLEDLREYKQLSDNLPYRTANAHIKKCQTEIKEEMVKQVLWDMFMLIGGVPPEHVKRECPKKYALVFSEYYAATGSIEVIGNVWDAVTSNKENPSLSKWLKKYRDRMMKNMEPVIMNVFYKNLTKEELLYMNEVMKALFFAHLKNAALGMSKQFMLVAVFIVFPMDYSCSS